LGPQYGICFIATLLTQNFEVVPKFLEKLGTSDIKYNNSLYDIQLLFENVVNSEYLVKCKQK
jgi:hypothetical protein